MPAWPECISPTGNGPSSFRCSRLPRARDDHALGYAFGHTWALVRGAVTEAEAAEMDRDDVPGGGSTGDVVEQIAELERRAGRLPLSVRAFYEVVGGTNFIGTHPAWEGDHLDELLDPLQVLYVVLLSKRG